MALPATALDKTQQPKSLGPELQKEAVRNGEFVQAVYDSFNPMKGAPYYGLPLFGKSNLFTKVLPDAASYSAYTITRFLYGTVKGLFPIMEDGVFWFGYIAFSKKNQEVVVVIRGTITGGEWQQNILNSAMSPFKKVDPSGSAYVHSGFLSMYTSKDESKDFGELSMRDQIMEELKKLGADQQLKVTVTGHSLGAALATLAACDIAVNFTACKVSLFTFGSPRVGDEEFKKLIEARTVQILRFTNVGDPVPFTPPRIWLGVLIFKLYTHVGEEVKLDWTDSPYVRTDQPDSSILFMWHHNLELYLHQLAAELTLNVSKPINFAKVIGAHKSSVEETWSTHVGNAPEAAAKLASLKELYKYDTESLNAHVQEVAYVAAKAKVAQEAEADDLPPPLKRPKLSDDCLEAYKNRDFCLLNKSDDILKPNYEVPASWLGQPPNKNMQLVNGKWLSVTMRPNDIPTPSNPDFFP